MKTTDKDNLSKCPSNKWFRMLDVWPAVKRPEYSLGRLIDFGLLETRVLEEREYFKHISK